MTSIFLLKRQGREADTLLSLLGAGVLRVVFEIKDRLANLRALMRR